MAFDTFINHNLPMDDFPDKGSGPTFLFLDQVYENLKTASLEELKACMSDIDWHILGLAHPVWDRRDLEVLLLQRSINDMESGMLA